MTDEGAALLRAILERPECDVVRGAYADWLDEHDRPEHAEFVRVQVELAATADPHSDRFWDGQLDRGPESYRRRKYLRQRERELLELHGGELARDVAAVFGSSRYGVDYGYNGLSNVRWEFRRGFVSAVSLTLGAFLGEPCDMPWGPPGTTCHKCGGTGTVEGVARRLFAAHPVERVTFVDKEPQDYHNNDQGNLYGWWEDYSGNAHRPCDIPTSLWGRLPGGERHGRWADYPTREAALTALSDAACRYGRELAGLTNGGER